MNTLHLDFETRSAIDITKVGAWAYAQHPSTEILCMGIARHGEEPTVYEGTRLHSWRWELGPDDVVSCHNASFEYACYNLILHRRYGWAPRWDPKLWSCTMARALACGLPAGLDELGRVLDIKTPKDLTGRSVMLKLCKPLSIDPLGDPVYDEDPLKLARLYEYNATDVKAEMEVDRLLPQLHPNEKLIWERDLAMNRRGVQVDLALARKATALAGDLTDRLNTKLFQITGGAVSKASRIAEIKRYIVSQGVEVPTKAGEMGEEKETLDKVAVLGLLADPKTPSQVKDVISIRQQVGKSSTAKYKKTLETAGPDGRVRGVTQYHAAHTGRDGGRLIQIQNYPKGFDKDEQARAISLMDNAADFAQVYGDKAMDALSQALRGTIIAAPGKQLIAADYNAIEARVNFWQAGDEAALATYRRGESPYLDMGAFIYKRPITKKDAVPYAVAKMTILGAGFGMGAERFQAQCAVSGIDVSFDLAKQAVGAFREKYSSVVRMWSDVEAAAIAAIKNPTRQFSSCAGGGGLLWGMSPDRRFLCCRLPSGRYLRYWKPSVDMVKTPWGETKEAMCYWGAEATTKTWCKLSTYGGALTENCTQAIARDILVHGWATVEDAGYPVVFKVHDELVAERTIGEGSLEDFIRLMCKMPDWADGLPMAAEGFVAQRYRK